MNLFMAQAAELGGVTSRGWQVKVVTNRCCRDAQNRSLMAILRASPTAQLETRVFTLLYWHTLHDALTGGAESMIRIASDKIVLQSSACTLCPCVGRARRSPSVDMRHTS